MTMLCPSPWDGGWRKAAAPRSAALPSYYVSIRLIQLAYQRLIGRSLLSVIDWWASRFISALNGTFSQEFATCGLHTALPFILSSSSSRGVFISSTSSKSAAKQKGERNEGCWFATTCSKRCIEDSPTGEFRKRQRKQPQIEFLASGRTFNARHEFFTFQVIYSFQNFNCFRYSPSISPLVFMWLP